MSYQRNMIESNLETFKNLPQAKKKELFQVGSDAFYEGVTNSFMKELHSIPILFSDFNTFPFLQTKDYAVEYYMNNVAVNLGPISKEHRLVSEVYLDGTKLNTTAILNTDGKKGSNRRQVS